MSFGYTDKVTLVQKLNQWVGFSISILQLNEFFLPNLLIGARGAGASKAGKRSLYNLCDIVTKASVAFVPSTAFDVHFKCCISPDAKIQASNKHETEVKPIHRKTRFHLSLPCSFRRT